MKKITPGRKRTADKARGVKKILPKRKSNHNK